MSAAAIPRSLVLTLAGLAAMASLSTNIVLPSLAPMGRQFAADDAAMNAVLSVFLATFALAQLVVGPWSDRSGRRRVVLAGLAVFIAGTALCAIADNLPTLLAGRAVQGLGAAAASVLARAVARDLFGGPALARLLGLIMVVMAAAPGFSPLLGGLIDRFFGWQAVFLSLAAIALGIGAAYVLVVGETLPAERRSERAITRIAQDYWGLARDRRFMAPALAVALVMGALFAFFGASPAILMQRFGLDTLQLGLFFSATVFVVFAAGLLAPRLTSRYGAQRGLMAGLLLALTGGAILLAAGRYPGAGLAAYVGGICVFLFGMGLASPIGTAKALTPFASAAGQASALLGFLQMAAAALATSLTMSLPLQRMTALGAVTFVAALLALLASYAGTASTPAPVADNANRLA